MSTLAPPRRIPGPLFDPIVPVRYLAAALCG